LSLFIGLITAGIFLSAFMTIKSIREEQKVDESWIEQEGNIYIERMEEEKKKKAMAQ
jgi:hypothetical protein